MQNTSAPYIPTSSGRLDYWDNLKGILIALVVIGHYFWEYRGFEGVHEAVYLIYVFHMPAFLFVSGYLSSGPSARSRKAQLRIFVLFLLMNTAMMLYGWQIEHRGLSFTNLYYSSWYLLALCLYRITLPLISRLPPLAALTGAILVSLGVGFTWRLDEFFELQKIVSLYPFFVTGYFAATPRLSSQLERLRTKPGYGWIAWIALATVSLAAIKSGVLSERHLLWLSYQGTADLGVRVGLVLIATAMIFATLSIIPQSTVPGLATWGRNSLVIYMAHRVLTLLLVLCFPLLPLQPFGITLLLSTGIITVAALGADLVARPLGRLLEGLVQALTSVAWLRRAGAGALVLLVVGVAGGMLMAKLMSLPSEELIAKLGLGRTSAPTEEIYRAVTPAQSGLVRDAVSISFVGDLILLRDQVYHGLGRAGSEDNYDKVFRYAKRYLSESDLSIGVFEGPLAGPDFEYSTSLFDDGIPLLLNFPDAFAKSVKKSGIDFVTLANNHLLDRGEAGAERTLEILDQLGLAHTGSYRSLQDKRQRDIPIVLIRGLKVAVLSYTYGSNGFPEEYFFRPDTQFRTSVIVSPRSPFFERNRASVIDDLRRAREKNPDAIVVLPHMGKQFSHATSEFQRVWVDTFIGAGADIVLADHPHAVQPIEWRRSAREGRRQALVVYCPGNFVNSYTAMDGDAMAIVSAYLNPQTGEPLAASVVPMMAKAQGGDHFVALPIVDLLSDPELQAHTSSLDMARMREVQATVTSVMLGKQLGLDQAQDRYFLFPDGYARQAVAPLALSSEHRSSSLFKALAGAKSACFVGDSVTAGTTNGGYGWFEPLVAALPNLKVERRAWGSHTVKMLVARSDEIAEPACDIFVIAIGTNDVRYRSVKNSAMSSSEYIASMDLLVRAIRQRRADAQFVLIGAWTTDRFDPVSVLDEPTRFNMLAEYRQALQAYALRNGHLFIDPNPALDAVFRTENPRKYLKDHIHPNAGAGLRLYSTKVLEASLK